MANVKLSDRTATTTSTGGFLHIVKALTSYKIAIENIFKTTAAVIFGGQAHSASYVKTFSASATFNCNDGNNQEMLVTASTTIGISNESPGTYIITLEIDTVTPPTITLGASLGTALDNNAALINADNDINIITVVVRPNATKYYSINTITA